MKDRPTMSGPGTQLGNLNFKSPQRFKEYMRIIFKYVRVKYRVSDVFFPNRQPSSDEWYSSKLSFLSSRSIEQLI